MKITLSSSHYFFFSYSFPNNIPLVRVRQILKYTWQNQEWLSQCVILLWCVCVQEVRNTREVGASRAVTPGSSTWGDPHGECQSSTQSQEVCQHAWNEIKRLSCKLDSVTFPADISNWSLILSSSSCSTINYSKDLPLAQGIKFEWTMMLRS